MSHSVSWKGHYGIKCPLSQLNISAVTVATDKDKANDQIQYFECHFLSVSRDCLHKNFILLCSYHKFVLLRGSFISQETYSNRDLSFFVSTKVEK